MKIAYYPKFDVDFNSMNLVFGETGHLEADTEWNFRKFLSPFNRLYFILDGIAYLRIEDRITELRPGNVYLIPTGCVTDYICHDHMEKLYHHFNIYSIIGKDYFSAIPDCMSMTYKITDMHNLIEAAKGSAFSELLFYKSEIYKVIGGFAEMALDRYKINFQAEYTEKAHMLFQFINKNLSARLLVKDCAHYMNMSTPALTKLFREQMGETLSTYLDSLLMQKILHLILNKDLTLKEIATHLNFSDQYYFSRFFKKHMGVPPNQYRSEFSFVKRHAYVDAAKATTTIISEKDNSSPIRRHVGMNDAIVK